MENWIKSIWQICLFGKFRQNLICLIYTYFLFFFQILDIFFI